MNPARRLVEIVTLKCEGASRLASQEMDEPLRLGDRFALLGHMLSCAHCRRFRGQLKIIRRAMKRPPPEAANHGHDCLSPDAKARMALAVREVLDSESEGVEPPETS